MVNKVYSNAETAITWTDTTGDLAMTLNNLATAAGRQGAVKDFGATAKANRYMWRAWVQFATAPVVDERVNIYLKTSDGTHPDNDDGTGNIAVSAKDKLSNLLFLGSIAVDQATASIEMVASGFVETDARYIMPVFWNDTADNLKATNNLSGFSLTPVPLEVQ